MPAEMISPPKLVTRVLLTGATGYVGRRLMFRLTGDPEIRLRLLVRNTAKLGPLPDPRIETFEGSTFEPVSLRRALEGIEVAFYLIHSLGAGGDFPELERKSAVNFREACIEAGVRRIIYLGGLGVRATASEHLRSRLETGELLGARPDRVRLLWFRAGIIIGSGSASFEIIRHLVQELPVMIAPRWVETRTQPIGIDDVVEYLYRGISLSFPGNLTVDIGAEPMSFREMMLRAAAVMGLRRYVIRVPLFSPRLSSYWLILMTPVPFSIARALVDGLKSESVAQNANAAIHFPEIRPTSYEKAIARAIEEIETNQVLSRWSDSSAQESCDIDKTDRISEAVYIVKKTQTFGEIPAARIYAAFISLGGDNGWPAFPGLWRLRGLWDKLAGGPGLSRGRRDKLRLRIGDSLDFWKVLDLRENERLLLLAQMKVPGRAWLEFSIRGNTLVQTAYFLPKGILGRLYWYSLIPVHGLIFKRLAGRIIENAPKMKKDSVNVF